MCPSSLDGMVRERINVIHGTHQFNDPETEVVQTLVATSSLGVCRDSVKIVHLIIVPCCNTEGCGYVREEENEGGQPGVFVCVQDWSEQLYWLLNRGMQCAFTYLHSQYLAS